MGLIICDKHGESGFTPSVSRKLSNMILADEIVDKAQIVILDFIFYEENEVLGIDEFYLLVDELPLNFSTDKAIEIRTDEDEAQLNTLFTEEFPRGGCCVKCFNEYLEKINWTKKT